MTHTISFLTPPPHARTHTPTHTHSRTRAYTHTHERPPPLSLFSCFLLSLTSPSFFSTLFHSTGRRKETGATHHVVESLALKAHKIPRDAYSRLGAVPDLSAFNPLPAKENIQDGDTHLDQECHPRQRGMSCWIDLKDASCHVPRTTLLTANSTYKLRVSLSGVLPPNSAVIDCMCAT